MRIALLWSLAIVMCELCPRLRTKRINRGSAPEVQSSGQSEELLACERFHSKERLIIRAKDKAFVEYDDSISVTQAATSLRLINCKTFTPPPKTSSTLRNLTNHTLPEDVIGLIGSFYPDVHCNRCELRSFNMTFFDRCRTALIQRWWARFRREVRAMGGSCVPKRTSLRSPFPVAPQVQTCMTSPKVNQVAICALDFDSHNLFMIEREERKIKKNEDIIQAEEYIKTEIQEHQELIKASQEFIKKKQKNIKTSQDVLDMRKQNIVYLKQIFFAPGDLVEIQGLVSDAGIELNGRYGKVVSFDDTRHRFAIKMQRQEKILLMKPENVKLTMKAEEISDSAENLLLDLRL